LTQRFYRGDPILSEKSNKAFPIIEWRIHSAEDAIEKLDAGASLVQLYTGSFMKVPLW
jgi:dihydroorotate dehydrogenase